MSKLIKNGQIVTDAWQRLVLAEGDDPATLALPTTPTLLPLAVWQARREELLKTGAAQGVWLDSNERPEVLAEDIDRLAVIAVNFPKFTDGRGYSIARLLRERLKFAGELRAIGEVLHDQLQFLSRCGFDALAVREGKPLEAAVAGLTAFSDAYQTDVQQPQPLFRRRA